jgi:hypothetical protein
MTISGVANFDMNFTELAEEAFERAGREMRTGYDLRTARRSANIMMAEWANRGINMWTIESGSIPMDAGTATYNLPADTVDLLEHVIRTGAGNSSTQADLTITRISVSTYATIPNKLSEARPIQVYIDRKQAIPTITVWPIPDQGTTLDPYYTFVYWRLRRMDNIDTGTDTADVNFRFLPCLTAGLAYYIAMKLPEGAQRLDMLKTEYEYQWGLAASEDREKAADRFVPRQYFIGSS